ncbi:MAG: hypothetical protein HUU32_13010 [Calditrichaceae bacterium]|nr:hypothetical protein [Calditrichia bacterium]NUQ42308.1 hypothetical protein [Calditrichaceae bacterium]
MKNQLFICEHKLIVLGLAVMLVMALLPGCSSSGANRRGKLSDAMGKASGKHEGDRKTNTEPPPRWETGEDVEKETVPAKSAGKARVKTASPPDSGVAANRPNVEEATLAGKDTAIDSVLARPNWFSLSFGKALTTQDGFAGLNQLDFTLGGYISQRWRGEIVIGVGWAPVEEGSELRNSLEDNVIILSIGAASKYYFTPQHTFLGNYFLGGLNLNLMLWQYKNSIEADVYDENGNVTGTEEIDFDGIGGLEIYLGMGFNLAQTRHFQLGLEVVPGIFLWSWQTTEGFDNDVFKPATYIKLKVVVNFRK